MQIAPTMLAMTMPTVLDPFSHWYYPSSVVQLPPLLLPLPKYVLTRPRVPPLLPLRPPLFSYLGPYSTSSSYSENRDTANDVCSSVVIMRAQRINIVADNTKAFISLSLLK